MPPSILLIFAACQLDPERDALQTRVAALEAKNATLQKQVDNLRASTEFLRAFMLAPEPFETAVFKTSDLSGYARVDSTLGPLLISIEDIKPQLDGFRIMLSVGNPSSVTYLGFKIRATWASDAAPPIPMPGLGPPPPSYREASFTENLTPGAWHRVRLDLRPATATDIANIRIALETNQVSLYKR
ncbi:MAG: DUF3251 domain-containing protein [Deltaproteobacteria bacterium]|nr:DUF3251 domain-containing protein [Deltaproteobacteria bacterium]